MQLRTHSLPLLNVAKNGSRVGCHGRARFLSARLPFGKPGDFLLLSARLED